MLVGGLPRRGSAVEPGAGARCRGSPRCGRLRRAVERTGSGDAQRRAVGVPVRGRDGSPDAVDCGALHRPATNCAPSTARRRTRAMPSTGGGGDTFPAAVRERLQPEHESGTPRRTSRCAASPQGRGRPATFACHPTSDATHTSAVRRPALHGRGHGMRALRGCRGGLGTEPPRRGSERAARRKRVLPVHQPDKVGRSGEGGLTRHRQADVDPALGNCLEGPQGSVARSGLFLLSAWCGGIRHIKHRVAGVPPGKLASCRLPPCGTPPGQVSASTRCPAPTPQVWASGGPAMVSRWSRRRRLWPRHGHRDGSSQAGRRPRRSPALGVE